MESGEIVLGLIFLISFFLLLRFALYRWIRYDDMQLAEIKRAMRAERPRRVHRSR